MTSVTYKGRPTITRHKSREELELTLSDAETMALIFERLGFRPVFRYEKYRTEYAEYYNSFARPDSPAMRDSNPTVVLIPGIGLLQSHVSRFNGQSTPFGHCVPRI